MPLVFESITAKLEAGAVDTTDVTGIPAGVNIFHLVAIAIYTSNGTPGTSDVDTLSGGGLTWARVAGTTACNGRISQGRGELWWAFGSPAAFTLTVDLTDVVRDAAGLHVTVSRISGAGDVAPINADYSNLNADSGGPSCTGGSDNDLPTLDMTVTDSDSMVLNMLWPRNETVDTFDADYTEEYFVEHTDGGDSTTMGIYTRIGGGGPTDEIQHLLDSDKPWYMIGCEIQIGGVTHTASGAPSITEPTATGVARRIVTATGTPAITKPTATGSALRKVTATGTPEITKPVSNGTARRIVKASGSPSIKKPTSQGQVGYIEAGRDLQKYGDEQYRLRMEQEEAEILAIVIAATTAIIEDQD